MLKKLYAFIRIDSKLKAMLTHFPSIEESWKVMAYIDHAGRPCRMLSLLQWWLQVATVYEAILGYPRSNLKRHWTTLNYGQTPKKRPLTTQKIQKAYIHNVAPTDYLLHLPVDPRWLPDHRPRSQQMQSECSQVCKHLWANVELVGSLHQ